MDITKFRAGMTGDGARPNLFQIQVNLPAQLQTLNTGGRFADKLDISCRAAQIPGSTLGKVVAQYQGREVFFAGNRTFADWTITVINDEDFLVRRTIEQWMAALNSHRTNVRRADLINPSSYAADCIVEHLGKAGPDSVIARYRMFSAFPIDLSPIELEWGTNDALEEYTVTFSFDYWE